MRCGVGGFALRFSNLFRLDIRSLSQRRNLRNDTVSSRGIHGAVSVGIEEYGSGANLFVTANAGHADGFGVVAGIPEGDEQGN